MKRNKLKRIRWTVKGGITTRLDKDRFGLVIARFEKLQSTGREFRIVGNSLEKCVGRMKIGHGVYPLTNNIIVNQLKKGKA